MMLDNFPSDAQEALDWQWADWQPYYQALMDADVNAETIDQWLKDWSMVAGMTWEVFARLSVAKDLDTTDEEAEARYKNFVATIRPEVQKATFVLNKKLVDSGLVPNGLAIPLRNIKAQIEIFREENLPLFTKISDLSTEYNKITGAQTVEWDGEEVTLIELRKVFKDPDRERRETAWHLMQERMKQDREAYNALWRQLMETRKQIYENAGFQNYRDYVWQDLGRHDYTPDDALQFCEAVEQVVVPVAERYYEQRRAALGLETLRPWDTQVDLPGFETLKPYETIEEFKERSEAVFTQVDPELGGFWKTMREETLLDLDNRKGKAPGGYCTYFPVAKRPFIFMNAVGLENDVRTLLHEAGHAFHGFSSSDLPYLHQRRAPMEFNEVASMAMELLASLYLTEDSGGYFDADGAARFRSEHLKGILAFWPYMAIVVAFQHWIYTNHEQASDPAECDKKWLELWERYMKGVDWSGYEDYILNRWRRQLHIFRRPFYYIEYGLAQLGAVQVWANALQDQERALAAYRKALTLGGTVKLPELYSAAGVKLAFDADTLHEAVTLLDTTIQELDAAS